MTEAAELPKRFDPAAISGPIYARWEESGHFTIGPDEVPEGTKPYVIVIPPPNVTAVLHMGHGLNNTIQDVLIRWQRMRGVPTLWVPGTDHAGIATQNVVERDLASEGKTRDDLGRDAFVERVWGFVTETEQRILQQLRAIGCSCDWTRTRFTLDDGLSRAVREVFVRLYEKGLVYRGEYIINWCPRCLTALSNEEAEGEEVEGRLYHLRYPLAESARGAAERAAAAGGAAVGRLPDGRWYLTVSTTRPETMLGDMAVAVNPKDERYEALVGADVELPLTGRTIPIVRDDFVDREFGTGMVKMTPAHDVNDFEMARRTGIEMLDVMTPDAHMNDNAPEAFRGMDRFEAREAVLAALDAEGLRAGDEAHTHAIPHCYRCHTVVEPRLSEQWFVRMKPLAEPALEASRSGRVTFTPERWTKVYEDWMENIRDWCISRQLWWGHRIPVWYCTECHETIVRRHDPHVCPVCDCPQLEQDPDVLDTWFSSWLWPFSTLGWPDETEDLRAFYPGAALSTAPEILFFWVARMIMAGYEFMGDAPFDQVYLHGTVRDKRGRKMSKSLQNGIDPLEVVDKFGADALRFTLISSCAVGTDIHLDNEDVESAFSPGRNFANKVWNAGRFALMNLGDDPIAPVHDVADRLELVDRWILTELSETTRRIDQELARFRLKEVADLAYHFFWGSFADWYLELVKPRMGDEADPERREAARSTLLHVLDRTLRLLHPLVPFVTEALFERLPVAEGDDRPSALIVAPWPETRGDLEDHAAADSMARLQQVVVEARRLRKEYGVKEGRKVTLELRGWSADLRAVLESERAAVERLAWIDLEYRDGSAEATGAGAHSVLPDGVELFMPLEGVIDLDRERERLADETQRLRGQLDGAHAKLANANFVERAPEDVVQGERDKAARLTEQIESLQEKLDSLRDR